MTSDEETLAIIEAVVLAVIAADATVTGGRLDGEGKREVRVERNDPYHIRYEYGPRDGDRVFGSVNTRTLDWIHSGIGLEARRCIDESLTPLLLAASNVLAQHLTRCRVASELLDGLKGERVMGGLSSSDRQSHKRRLGSLEYEWANILKM